MEAGHTAEKLFVKNMNISYCTGCGYCFNHRGTCHQMGNDKAFLIKVISQCLPFIGYPRSLNALTCVRNAADGMETE